MSSYDTHTMFFFLQSDDCTGIQISLLLDSLPVQSMTRVTSGKPPNDKVFFVKITGEMETFIHAHPLESMANVLDLVCEDILESLQVRLHLFASRLQTNSKGTHRLEQILSSSASSPTAFEIELPRRGWLSDPLVESSIFSALSTSAGVTATPSVATSPNTSSSSLSSSSSKSTKKSKLSSATNSTEKFPLHRRDIPFLSLYSFSDETYHTIASAASMWLSVPKSDFSIRFNEIIRGDY